MDKKRYLLVAFLGLLITTVAVGATTLAFGGRANLGANGNSQTWPAKEQRQAPANMQAITNNDYNSWAASMTTRVAEMRQQASDLEAKINQETFNKLVQAHELMQAGKQDEAKAIFDELGMFGPFGGRMGDKGMGHGPNAASTNTGQTTE
ncbi:MAG: hypothetical protein WC465_02330 [Patescibacteria group bacterium]